uniref:Uncharacterized protein n=1 Tax=Eutreptiella gymnastica TaxID=73025 RepID=A0A7S1NQE0_9EUGL|mmetsp:Transcript_6501/g.11661  ORF Transcript_6501/g.11661 Transcript_6501/m.11661 type:complete len:105 (+) Transcript_6501:208-522(+)
MSNAGFTLTTMDSAATVAKKRATEKRKRGAHAQIPYTDGERAIALTAMQERAVGGKVPFASVADFLITEYSFSGLAHGTATEPRRNRDGTATSCSPTKYVVCHV